MTIDEAIKDLDRAILDYRHRASKQAIYLGVGALEQIKLIRELESEKGKYRFGFLLPSEEEQCQK